MLAVWFLTFVVVVVVYNFTFLFCPHILIALGLEMPMAGSEVNGDMAKAGQG